MVVKMRKLISGVICVLLLVGSSAETRAKSFKRAGIRNVVFEEIDLTVSFGSLKMQIGQKIDPGSVKNELRLHGFTFETLETIFMKESYELPAIELRGIGFQIVYLEETNFLIFVSSSRKDWVMSRNLKPGTSIGELMLLYPSMPKYAIEGILDCTSRMFPEFEGYVSDTGFYFWISFLYEDGIIQKITARLAEYAS